MTYDFAGWATRNDLKCSDGRTIRKNAFKDNDGKKVPLVWNHQHNDPMNVLGHALLQNRDEGVYAYCTFNDTESGQAAKTIVEHGDVESLSIYANQLRQNGGDVIHGLIREVSLVLAGANPGAYIESVLRHGESSDEEGIIYSGERLSEMHFEHADEPKNEGGSDKMAEEKKEQETKPESEETVKDVFDTLTDKQKTVVYAMIGQAIEDAQNKDNEEEDEDNMKHNVFESDIRDENVLCHADQEEIIRLAKSNNVGSLQTAIGIFAEENELQHDATAGGFAANVIDQLFPEYKEVRPGAPELITDDQGWIDVVMRKVHKSPISRIRTTQVDIRNIDSLRAKGYQKGKQKSLAGNFSLVRRTTDPQTVYVKNALHRDDIVDITDFDYVQYLYKIDRMQLNEELATAILFGDGREEESADKIDPEHIRPIYGDDALYTIYKELDVESARSAIQGTDTSAHFGDNYVYAEAMIEAVLDARRDYRGTGTPDLFCTQVLLNKMLLARDFNGRRIYNTKAELASALNVGNIYTVDKMENKTREKKVGNVVHTMKPLALIGNLGDYSVGATKGGEITHFTQFDIDFNQEKSLIETRCSGALTRVYSMIAIEEDVTENP